MKVKSFLLIALCLFLASACSDKDVAPAFEVKTTGEIVLKADAGAEKTVNFHSTRDWTAAVSGSNGWLSCSPSSGVAGDVSVKLKVNEMNTSDARRSASLVLTSGDLIKKVPVYQEAADFVKPEKNTYNVPAQGDSIRIIFETNIPQEELFVSRTDVDWLTQPEQSRAVIKLAMDIIVLPNDGASSRTASLYFLRKVGENKYKDVASVGIVQAGSSAGESVDYSADKQVRTIQTATKGEGIPIVIMGDGFIDKEIADGTYDRVMDKAVENFFTEEPVASLREYFSIYAVTAVSKHNTFGEGYQTAFSCELEGGKSTLVSGNNDKVVEYAGYVPDIDLNNTLAMVIVNTPAYAGTAYFGFSDSETKKMVEFAIAYCPVIDNLDSENFRAVLVHESVGHGFAKLDDEYSYEEQGTMPEEEIKQRKDLQSYNWSQNVDFTSDESKVLWAQFLTDDRYKDEGLGVFEGACTYIKGAYRPSEQSMMNGNQGGFNAPSRKAIYDMVFKRGMDATPDYEEFVTFDRETQAEAKSASRAAKASTRPFARPQFMGGKPIR